jgi:hypothetical protein
MRLIHVSEERGIARFEPRVSALHHEPVVWAIDDDLLHLYLAPRDCPRVCFRSGPDTTADDRARFLTPAGPGRVVAIEHGWLARFAAAQLALYEMPSDAPWILKDESAGYWVSAVSVAPVAERVLGDLPAELERRDVELRTLPRLHELGRAVAASSLVFNLIRMRNAAP